MKKFFSIIAIALLAIGFIGCEQTTTTTVDTQFTAPETLAMADVDDYLFRADFQFVDVRNFLIRWQMGGLEDLRLFHSLII